MTSDLKSQGSKIFLLSLILISLSVFFFRDSISLFPSFIHAWTQSDRYALALGFLNNGFDFFHPQTFNLISIDGITRVDFPIHEYIVAIIMKVTGIHEPIIFRIYTLLYALIGLIFLFCLSQLFSKSYFKNVFVVLFIFLCPVFMYYADGFIPSIPSLSNLFIGNFFYFRYKKEKSVRDFRLAVLFLTLAALARLPFFIFLFAVFCQQALTYFQNKKIQRKEIFAFGISFAMLGGYQLYNSYLGKKYGSQFLNVFLPPKNTHQLIDWLEDVRDHWKFEYFTKSHYLILGILILVFVIQLLRKKISLSKLSDLFIQFAIAGIGSVLYFFLMLQQFPDHDYYFIDAFYPVVVLLLLLLLSFSFASKILNYGVALVIAALMFQSFTQAREVLSKRYETGYWDRDEITRKNFTGTEKYLDSIGIAKDAKVLVLDGYTTNVPFILMNRKGWAVNWTTKERIEEGMTKPFDLVAIQNCFVASDVVKNDSNLITRLEKFSDNGLVGLYRRKENPNQTLDQFFGIDSSKIIFSNTKTDSIFADANSEFIEILSDSASKFVSESPKKILITGKIFRNEDAAPQLTASVNSGDITSYYFSFDLHDYTIKSGEWQNMMFQFVLPANQNPSGKAKVYFWNNQKGKFNLRDLRVVVYR